LIFAAYLIIISFRKGGKMKKKLLISTLVVVSLFSVNFALAVSGNGLRQSIREEVQEKKDEVKTVVQAAKHAKAVAKCDIASSKIEKRVENYDHQKEKHSASYQKTRTKIEALIKKLEERKLDVAKLKEDLVTFDSKIKQFNDDYAKYIALLKETQTDSCAKSEDDFKTKLNSAREQLKVVHEDAVAIRTFYAKTIRPDVLAVKAQKAATETEADTTTGTNTNTNTTTAQ
jgi:chromosome segregation ATPase